MNSYAITISLLLARLELPARRDGRQVPRRLRRRGAGHGTDAPKQRPGREPELETAQLLHAASPARRLVPEPGG